MCFAYLRTKPEPASAHPLHCAGRRGNSCREHEAYWCRWEVPVSCKTTQPGFQGKANSCNPQRTEKTGRAGKIQRVDRSGLQQTMVGADHLIKYLGQYTHRVAITNQRIIAIDEKGVTFMHKDYVNGAKQKPVTLDGVELLRRFCQHILPFRFVKIRRYGIYSSRYQALKKKQNPKMELKLKPKETTQERIKRLTGIDVFLCPFCKKGMKVVTETLPKIRSPASFYALTATCRL